MVGLPFAAGAEPGEDGAHPDPAGYYDATPLTGWMTEGPSDRVHDIAQIGNTVYVAGIFGGVRPSAAGPVTSQSHLAAFDATTGAHIAAFDPVLNGTVYSLAVAPDGSRLYAAGAFTKVDGGNHRRVAALDPVTGDPVAGFDADTGGGSVRSIVAWADDLYIGGNFGWVEAETRMRLARLDATTGAVDLAWAPTAQTDAVLTLEIPSDGSRVYAGGRFGSVNGQPGSAHLVALSPADGSIISGFVGQPGREVYDLVATDDGRVYAAEGGYLGRAEAYDGAGALLARWDTYGDVQAVEQVGDRIYFGGHELGPAEVENVAVVDPDDLTDFDVALFNTPLDQGDGVWAFHATATELWLGGQSTTPYFGIGRYAPTDPPPPRTDLVPVGSSWRYLDDGSDQGSAWRQPGFDDTSWPVGAGQLGFGDGDEATVLQSGAVTYWFRQELTVAGAALLSDVRLSMVVDDGAVAYVNGTEVARHNLPAGPIDASTPASTTAFGPAETIYTHFDVPAGLLVDGSNTIAVEVHQVLAGSSDLSFEGRLSAVVLPDVTAPTVPVALQAASLTDTTFTLQWDPSTDDVGVDHYEVFQDSVSIGTTGTNSIAVSGLAPSTTYEMSVEAADAAGNRSGRSAALAVTTEAPQGPPGEIHGMVTEDGSGAPIEGVLVAGVGPFPHAAELVDGTFTDASGAYQLDALPPGDYLVALVDPELDHGFEYYDDAVDVNDATLVTVGPGAVVTADASLAVTTPPPGGPAELSGVVTETGSAAPIEDVLVFAIGDGGIAGIARTDAAGAYSLDLAPGDYALEFVATTGDHLGEWHEDHPLSDMASAEQVALGAGGLVLDADLDPV